MRFRGPGSNGMGHSGVLCGQAWARLLWPPGSNRADSSNTMSRPSKVDSLLITSLAVFPHSEPKYSREYLLTARIENVNVLLYRVIRDQYMIAGEGFLLVYLTTSRESCEETSRFHRQSFGPKDKDNVPILLIGNKYDLDYERQASENGK